MTTKLHVNPSRLTHRFLKQLTGIEVRALLDGVEGSYDIAVLDKESFYALLKRRQGRSEDVLGIFRGHGRTLGCTVCGEKVTQTPAGWCCKYGHKEDFDAK